MNIRALDYLPRAELSSVMNLEWEHLDELASSAHLLGFEVIALDLADCASKSDLLKRVAVAAHFPESFGHNWDALTDALSDMAWLPACGYLFIIRHSDVFIEHHPEVFGVFHDILVETTHFWAGYDTPFWCCIVKEDC